MEPIILEDRVSGSTARIAPELGFNCYSFQAVVNDHLIDVLDADPQFVDRGARPSGHGIPILFPFPNRIRDGRFSFDGREYKLPDTAVPFDNAGNAIHGFCLDRPWRVKEVGANFAVGEFQLSKDAPDRLEYWPADCSIAIRYELRGTTLHAGIRIVNPSDSSLPWGFGTHPYFRVPLAPQSDPKHCLVVASATEQWDLVDCLPTGGRRPVAAEKDLRDGAYFDQVQLDDVLTGLNPAGDVLEFLIIDEQSGLQIRQRCDKVFRELVVFTPPNRNAVCLEPYTCVTDAVNLSGREIDAGLRTLEPGGEFRTWIDIHAERVIA
jgi:aldose 1-epimerase